MRTLLADDEKLDTTGFGPRLRALREAAGLTRQQVADRTGFTPENIARLERGDRSPSWKSVLKLADALGVEPNDFRDDDADEPPAGTGTAPRPRGK